jgi:hypothetical protein
MLSDSWEVSSEDLLCELEDFMCATVQQELGVRNPVRLVWLPCYEYVMTTEGRLRRLACNDCKLCKCITV